MRNLVTIVLSLILCGNLFAADFSLPSPPQKIELISSPIEMNGLVSLKISDVKDKPNHLEGITYTWQVFDIVNGQFKELSKEQIRLFNNELIFGAGVIQKKVLIQVAVTYLFVVKDKISVGEINTKTVILNYILDIDGQPTPPNPPNPPLPINVPDGKFGLTKFAFEITNNVNKEFRKDGAFLLKSSFEYIADEIKMKKITQITDVLKKTNEMNIKTFKENNQSIDNWQTWAIDLQKKLKSLYDSGELKSLDNYYYAWQAIAKGLEISAKNP